MLKAPKSQMPTRSEAKVAPVFRIRQVDSSDVRGIDIVTELHMDLLGFGPMAQFGYRFIRETVYVPALADKIMDIAVAEVDGQPAGFIAYSTQAQTFHKALMRNHLLTAAWEMGIALLTRPTRIRHLPRAFKVVFSRNEMPDNFDDTRTEVICFGVKPEYLAAGFVRETKLRVGHLLLEHAFDYFRQRSFNRTRMIVDADNPRALLFYQSLGASFNACTFGGVPSYVVVFDL